MYLPLSFSVGHALARENDNAYHTEFHSVHVFDCVWDDVSILRTLLAVVSNLTIPLFESWLLPFLAFISPYSPPPPPFVLFRVGLERQFADLITVT